MEIILYSTHCPLCKGLEKSLNQKNISYTLCTDMNIMRSLGIKQAPMLSVDGELMKAPQALRWVLKQE